MLIYLQKILLSHNIEINYAGNIKISKVLQSQSEQFWAQSR